MADAITETIIAIRNPFDFLWISFVKFFPKLIGLIVLLIVGYLTGLVLGHVLRVILQKAGLDRWLDKAELSKAVGRTHISSILGEILKWYVFIVFLQAAVNIIDLGPLSEMLGRFVLWLPHLILAIIVVLIGLVFAHFIELKIIAHSKVKGVRAATKLLKWVIIFMIIVIALKQIGLQVGLLENAFLLILGALAIGVALALGISLGLGLKKDSERLVRNIMKNF